MELSFSRVMAVPSCCDSAACNAADCSLDVYLLLDVDFLVRFIFLTKI